MIIKFSCVQNVWVCFLSLGTAIFSKAVRTPIISHDQQWAVAEVYGEIQPQRSVEDSLIISYVAFICVLVEMYTSGIIWLDLKKLLASLPWWWKNDKHVALSI